jgi:hypothetical protein
MAELIDSFIATPKEGAPDELPEVSIRWYSDGAIRITIEGYGPVYVDELYIHQRDPLIRIRPQEKR